MKKNIRFMVLLSSLSITALVSARSELESISHKQMNDLKAECIAAAQLQKIDAPQPSDIKRLEKDSRWKELNAAFPELSTKVLHCLWADTAKERLANRSSILDEERSPLDSELNQQTSPTLSQDQSDPDYV